MQENKPVLDLVHRGQPQFVPKTGIADIKSYFRFALILYD